MITPRSHPRLKAKPARTGSCLKPSRPKPKTPITFEDDLGATMWVGADSIVIYDVQRAALSLAKNVLDQPRFTENVYYNDLIIVHVFDNYRLQINDRIIQPTGWNNFVKEFEHVIKMKAFV